jgi:hypothetical protein
MRRSQYFLLAFILAVGSVGLFGTRMMVGPQSGLMMGLDGIDQANRRLRSLLTDRAKQILKELAEVETNAAESAEVRRKMAERIAELRKEWSDLDERNQLFREGNRNEWTSVAVSMFSNVTSLAMAVLSCYFTWLGYRVQKRTTVADERRLEPRQS